MRLDNSAIPEPADPSFSGGAAILARLYRDIGLATVAAALGMLIEDLEPDLKEAILRGKGFLTIAQPRLAS